MHDVQHQQASAGLRLLAAVLLRDGDDFGAGRVGKRRVGRVAIREGVRGRLSSISAFDLSVFSRSRPAMGFASPLACEHHRKLNVATWATCCPKVRPLPANPRSQSVGNPPASALPARSTLFLLPL